MVARNCRLNLLSPSADVVQLYGLPLNQPHRLAVCVLGLVLSLSSLPSAAQAVAPASSPSSLGSIKVGTSPRPSSVLTLPKPFAGLDWSALTPSQQLALKPLANSWTSLSDPQKRKWISLSANYARMSPADQTTLHERMAQWAALSPRQRQQARLNFAEAQKIAPMQKAEKWQAYQALSPEEKQTLAKSVRPTPPRTALATQPVVPGKLNRLPLKPSLGLLASPTASAPELPSSMASMPAPDSSSAPAPAASHDAAKP